MGQKTRKCRVFSRKGNKYTVSSPPQGITVEEMGQKTTSQKWSIATWKWYFLTTAGSLDKWAHGSWDTSTRPVYAQARLNPGEGVRHEIPPHSRSYWTLLAADEEKDSGFPKSGAPEKSIHTKIAQSNLGGGKQDKAWRERNVKLNRINSFHNIRNKQM